MTITELIANRIPPIKTSDSIQSVLDRMDEFCVKHLPVVSEVQFLGIITEEDIVDIPNQLTTIASLDFKLPQIYILDTQHLYDALRIFHEQKITILPVLNHQMDYLGLLTVQDFISYLANITAVSQAGGIIVLEISNRDNSLAHIAQIIESENAQILSSYTNEIANSTKIEVTLKVNKLDLMPIVASLLRYEYVVSATYNYADLNSGNSDRFDEFMNYLNM
jgi:acetoin utilization protein AcuB